MNVEEVCGIIDREFKGKAVEDALFGTRCVYKTVDGKKCLIGLFIPEGHPAQRFRGGVYKLIETYPDLLELMPSKNIEVLRNLQIVHDEMNGRMRLEKQKEHLKNNVKQYIGG